MDMRTMAGWQRIECDDTPIYIRPDAPDWFVPNQMADEALVEVLRHGKASREITNLLKRIDMPVEAEYQSRRDVPNLDRLEECWLHITNRCNMHCRHCMFKSSPGAGDELTYFETGRSETCHYCGKIIPANARCASVWIS